MHSVVAGTTHLLERYPYSDDDDYPESIVWPVELERLKQHAQVRHNLEDELLTHYLQDATEYVERRGQVSLIHQRRRQVLDHWPRDTTVQINCGPLVSVESVTILDAAGDTEEIDTGWRADVRSRPGGVYFTDDDPPTLSDGPGVVWIDYTAGFGTSPAGVPAMWQQLILAIATHCYERREMASGGGTEGGGLDAQFERIIARRLSAAGRNYRYV